MTDKILFWLDANLIYFGIAKYLQDKYECESYAIIEVPSKQKNFFEKQTLTKFKKSWFYFDDVSDTKKTPNLEYLSNFEKKYDINLWLLAYNERYFFNYNDYYKFTANEVLNILEQECRFFEKILDDAQPNFIIMGTPNLHHSYLFNKICLTRNIKCLILGPTRFGNRCILSQEVEKVDSIYPDEKLGPERTHLELINYLKNYNIYQENAEYTEKFMTSKISHLKASLNFLFSNNDKIKTHYPYYGRTKLKIILKTLGWMIREKYRLFFINRNLTKNIDSEESFVYFPLQIDLEATLLIYAPFFTNPVELITNIVKSLPVGYKLYVKDHPHQHVRGWRNISFYKSIMNLPNVKLLHHSVNPEELLERSSLVMTIASTTGLEAAFHKKPTVIFADVIYSILPSVYRVKNIEELPKIIRSALKTKVNISDVNKFVNYIHNNSIEFSLSKFTTDTDEHFYYGGFLVDLEITEEKMKSYLEKYQSKFEQLVSEHIKKLNYYKNTNNQ